MTKLMYKLRKKDLTYIVNNLKILTVAATRQAIANKYFIVKLRRFKCTGKSIILALYSLLVI